MKKFLFIVIFLLFSNTALAESVTIKAQVDKTKITIGDKIRYQVMLEYDKGVEIEPLSHIGENLGEFEIKDYKIDFPKKTREGRWTSSLTYIISTFTTGEYTIPPLKINYKDVDGKEKDVASQEIKISVESVKPKPDDKDDIRPLKPPADIKGDLGLLFFIIILLLIIGIAAFLYYRNKKNIKEEIISPPRPPEEIAREELKALLEAGLVEKGMIKEYYIRLSDIMRKFIEGRFKIFALDRTTWELYQEMRSRRFERGHVDKINDFLENCDLVKFAKYIPTQKETEEIYKQAEDIVAIC